MSGTGTGNVIAQAYYFGKVPSRGDFVRSTPGSALIQSIDQWLSQAMEMLSEDVRWKITYDTASAIQFAILGTRSPSGLVGHLMASQDASGRRFPFTTMASFDVPQPQAFLARSPLALSRIWQRMEAAARAAHGATDFASAQEQIAELTMELTVQAQAFEQPYRDFKARITIDRLERLLAAGGDAVSVRQTLLALGMLLQPVLTQGHAEMSKGLVLPLPQDALQLPFVLTLWIDLIGRFFKRSDTELGLFVTQHAGRRLLVLGFHGASPSTLRNVLDPDLCLSENVAVSQAQWVEDWIGTDYGLRKLSNYLRDPELSLAQAVDTFGETFLGD
ncbi:MAG TPA: type VI secretion system-associated protein TagF [Ideonella sp.]|nr:type VI secretion system-associated protein TagF [Ideonella sp.]